MAFASALLQHAEQDREAALSPVVEPEGIDPDCSSVSLRDTDDQEDATGSLYRWTVACVLLLLETFKSFQEKLTSGKMSQKKVWEEIASILQKKGHTVTGPQCAAKLRSLKKTYKGVKDHNNKSGNDRRTWQFFEVMDEIFSKAAWCQPVALASTSGLPVNKAASPSTSGLTQSKGSCSTSELSDSGCLEVTPKEPKKGLATLLAKRLRQKEQSEEEKAKRHRERMVLEERRLSLDERLVAVLEALANKSATNT